MHYLLYNPLASAGKGEKYLHKVEKIYKKRKIETKSYSLLSLNEYKENLLSSLTEEDVLVIIGGDGTLNTLFGEINFKELPCKVFMYRAGSGNDFARGHKGRLFEITEEIKDLPFAYVNGEKKFFINGIGLGIDAAVCRSMNNNNKKNGYYRTALNEFKKFKPFNLKFNADGKEYEYNNVFFFVVMNGKYFGGGMKIAPMAKRNDDHLDVIVITAKSFWTILPIFPTVFFGWHLPFKKFVKHIKVKDLELISAGYDVLQADGEPKEDVKTLTIHRYEKD